MSAQIEKISDIKRRLTITIDAEAVEKEKAKVFKTISHEVQVPGFRPGKAPLGLLKRRYGEYAEGEVKRNLASEHLQEAIKAENLQLAGETELEKAEFDENGGLTIIAILETWPEVKLSEYKGIPITRDKLIVLETAVENRLEGLRLQHAVEKEITDRDICQKSDFVRIDFEGKQKKDNKPVPGGSSKNYLLELGTQTFIPGFEDGVIGMKLEETKDIELTFPVDYVDKQLAGTPAIFTVTLNAIVKRELPALDDEFAKDTGEADTIDGLRQLIRDNIRKGEEARLHRAGRKAIIEALVQRYPIEVPGEMVNNQAEYMLRNYKMEMMMAGLPIKQDKEMDNTLKERFKESAYKEVQSFFIFREIAKAEKIEVSDAEIETRLQEIATRQGQPLEKVSAYYQKENMLDVLKDEILEDKVVDFMLENAETTWVDPITEKEDATPTETPAQNE